MCGIFGVYGHPDASALTQLGLYSLQHRGQEFRRHRRCRPDRHRTRRAAHGPRVRGLRRGRDAPARGPIAVGHTRYSTAGSSTLENAQPIPRALPRRHIALAHNGNLINATELRRELEDGGSIFVSTMDSEVLVHRIARSAAESAADSVADALQGVEGAYCLLVVIGDVLVAARDPRGWRPLVIGRLGDAWVVASESCALDIVGPRSCARSRLVRW
jgi:amidophosphoribosyltransferase